MTLADLGTTGGQYQRICNSRCILSPALRRSRQARSKASEVRSDQCLRAFGSGMCREVNIIQIVGETADSGLFSMFSVRRLLLIANQSLARQG
jgi:hypothetical protein